MGRMVTLMTTQSQLDTLEHFARQDPITGGPPAPVDGEAPPLRLQLSFALQGGNWTSVPGRCKRAASEEPRRLLCARAAGPTGSFAPAYARVACAFGWTLLSLLSFAQCVRLAVHLSFCIRVKGVHKHTDLPLR